MQNILKQVDKVLVMILLFQMTIDQFKFNYLVINLIQELEDNIYLCMGKTAVIQRRVK